LKGIPTRRQKRKKKTDDEKGDSNADGWAIKIRYINETLKLNVEQYRTFQIPFGGKTIPMDKASIGSINYSQFKKEIMDVRKPFNNFEDWNAFSNPTQ